MEIIKGTFDFQLNRETAVAIGKFDGLHLGHQKLIQKILDKKKQGLAACVFTFDPSPAVFFGAADMKELSTREEKRALFEERGVDILVEYQMTKESASVEPEYFVRKILSENMHTCYIAAGEDVSFGARGAGNAKLLSDMAAECGYQVEMIEKVSMEGVEISSSLVRQSVKEGNMSYVQKLLGTPYTIIGEVKHGKALGRRLGMPTVNLLPEKDKLLPSNGVYFSEVVYNGKTYQAITNIGCKPTVSEEKRIGVESYLYDFQEEIYGEQIKVRLLEYKRPEMHFTSVEELKAQMQKDIEAGKMYQNS